MTLLVFWWLTLYWTYSSSWPRPFDDWKNVLFYSGAGLFIIYQLWKHRAGLKFAVNPFTVCVLLYFLIIVISLCGSNTPIYEGYLEISRLVLWVGFVWGLSRLNISDGKWIARTTVISAALIASLTFLQIKGFNLWPYSGGFMAPIGHVSYYGDFMALHVPMAIYLVVTSCQKTLKTIWSVATLFILSGLWVSGTRASIVGLLSAFLLVLILLKWIGFISWRKFFVIPIVFVALVIMFHTLQPLSIRGESPIKRLQHSFMIKGDSSSADRWSGYLKTLHMVSDRPNGWGVGSFRFIYPEYDYKYPHLDPRQSSATKWYMHPHNELLHQGAELGLLGLIFFLGIWGFIFYGGIKFIKTNRDHAESFLVIMALAGLMISFVSWQFSTNFLFPLSRLMTAFYGAILLQKLSLIRWSFFCFRKYALVPSLLVLLVTVFLSAYHVSLYLMVKSSRVTNQEEKFMLRKSAFFLAPRAFEPLYSYATAVMQNGAIDQALPIMNQLYAEYPFIPFVLFQNARLRIKMGKVDEARELLQHSLANDPNFIPAKNLLNSLEGESK